MITFIRQKEISSIYARTSYSHPGSHTNTHPHMLKTSFLIRNRSKRTGASEVLAIRCKHLSGDTQDMR